MAKKKKGDDQEDTDFQEDRFGLNTNIDQLTKLKNLRNSNSQQPYEMVYEDRFKSKIEIEKQFYFKTNRLHEKYMKAREKPILCKDNLLLAYEVVIERMPIFSPYQKQSFEIYRNRYNYAKKTGFYVEIPKDMKLENGDDVFSEYDASNDENQITHQISLSSTQKINYRENSRVWKWTDPNITDPHSIQTHSSNNVFLIVKQNGKWKFPSRILTEKDDHNNFFDRLVHHLFGKYRFPVVHFPKKTPVSITKVMKEDLDRGDGIRYLTFKGVLSKGCLKFQTSQFEDYAWVPKPHIAKYFEDAQFQRAVSAATHLF